MSQCLERNKKKKNITMNKQKNQISDLTWYAVPILVIVIPILLKPGFVFLTDLAWGPQITVDFFKQSFLLNSIVKILSLILPIAFIQKLFITGVLAAIILSGRSITRNFFDNKFVVWLASLLTLVNPFVYDRLMYGQLHFLLAFALFGFGFSHLIRLVQSNQIKNLFKAAIYFSFSLVFSAHFLFFIGLVGIIFFLLYLFRIPKNILNKQKLKKIVLWSLLICIVINLNWIIGVFATKTLDQDFIGQTITKEHLFFFRTAGETGQDALLNVILLSGFWGSEQHRYLDIATNTNFRVAFIMLVPLLIYGVWRLFKDPKTKKIAIGLIIMWIVAITLAVGIRLPITKQITEFMFDNFPFYKGMRDTAKWISLIVLVYTVWFACGVYGLTQSKVFKSYKTVFITTLIFLVCFQSLPLFGAGYGQINPARYPPDWQEVDQYLLEQDCDGNTLFLPWHMYMSFNWIGRIVANPANLYFECPVIIGTNIEIGNIYSNNVANDSNFIEDWIKYKAPVQLLKKDELNIKYIILAKELEWEDYLWMEKDEDIEKIIDTKNLLLYKIK